jgi:hypothetical protein
VTTDSAAGRELATSYEIHRGATSGFTTSAATRINTIAPPNFGGTSSGKVSYTDVGGAGHGYFYKIIAINAAGKSATSAGF